MVCGCHAEVGRRGLRCAEVLRGVTDQQICLRKHQTNAHARMEGLLAEYFDCNMVSNIPHCQSS